MQIIYQKKNMKIKSFSGLQ